MLRYNKSLVVAMFHFHLQFKYMVTSDHLANYTSFTAQYSNKTA